jgi:hypothetical protein
LIVTLLNRRVSGLAGRFGVTTARRLENPSELCESAEVNASPAGPDLEPMIRSMWAISLPSPTSDSPIMNSPAITASVSVLLKKEKISRHMVCSTLA